MQLIRSIRRIAKAQPKLVAVKGSDEELTYRRLIRRVDGLASDLRARGIRTNSRVAINLDRSPDMIVAILATIAAGATYVPLDTEFPVARLRFAVEDSESALILGRRIDEEITQKVPNLPPESWTDRGPTIDVESHGPAYLIYTSGSTGKPKGVVIGRGALSNYLAWTNSQLPFNRGGVPLFASVGFDHSITCYLPPLMMGDTLILLPPLLGGQKLAAGLLAARHYSYVKITPSHFRLLDPDQRAELGRSTELLVFGGERLTANLIADARRDRPTLAVMNHYGPTETTVGCCVYRVPPGMPSDPIPIGRPIPGNNALVCGEDGKPQSAGEAGELLIGGKNLARGYWRSTSETAAKFISRADDRGGTRRWYRTGDTALRLQSGELLYLGRNDDQVKILGYRIEIPEVEAVLRAHPGIRQASVFVVDPDNLPSLVAAVEADDTQPTEAELRAYLYENLPRVMVPRRIAFFPKLPLGIGGKLDRKAVLDAMALGTERLATATIEETVARKFAEALGQSKIQIDDDFFELGGDSLATVDIALALRKLFDVPLEATALFAYPTIRTLANYIQQYLDQPSDTATPWSTRTRS